MRQGPKKVALCLVLIASLVAFPLLNGCVSWAIIAALDTNERPVETTPSPVVNPERPQGERDLLPDIDPPAPETEDELKDARKPVSSYTIVDESYERIGTEVVGTLDNLECQLKFDVEYPQLQGLDASIQEKINQTIRDRAMYSVRTMYLEPTEHIHDFIVENGPDDGNGLTPAGIILESTVRSYVTYNDDTIISIAFDDHFCIGSYYSEYRDLTTTNIDLSTGEEYRKTNEIVQVTQELADLWHERALAQVPDSFFFDSQPKEDFVFLLADDENFINRYFSRFYIDSAGKIHIALTYHMGNDAGIARGWIDAALSAEELKPYRTQSAFWQLYDNLVP